MLDRALVLAALAAATLGWPGTAQAAVAAHVAGSNSASAPTRFSVIVEGSGPDVILVPGLSSTRDVFTATAARLKANHRVHLVQVKGFGEAAGPNATGPVLQPFVDDLAAYIRANHLVKPAIVGHSMGGLAALMLAAQTPALPGKLMIVDAFPFIGPVFGADSVAAIKPRAEQMKAVLLAKAAGFTPAFGASANCPTDQATPAKIVGNMTNSALGQCLMKHGAMASDLRVVAQAMYDDMMTDLRPKLEAVRVPVTVLYPQDDRLIGKDEAAALYGGAYARTPQLRLVPITGSYHFIMQDQPAKFAAAVGQFLE